MKTALAVRHLAFEDLGLLGPILAREGYAVDYLEAGVDAAALAARDPLAPDLVVVLGGPISAYDGADYPWLDGEIAWLRARLLADRPTLGICLGAQLMAAALQAAVYPGDGKEIGWSPLSPGSHGARVAWFADYLDAAPAVLHWHGDTFDLPLGARHLASSGRYRNQAFAWGQHGLALQFHAEFDPGKLEQWLVGHALEISLLRGQAPHVTPALLRQQAALHGEAARHAAGRLFSGWLASLQPPAAPPPERRHDYRCMRNF